MLSFSTYLVESANEEKLTHLEHAEDHPINAGEEGFKHVFNTLNETHNALLGKRSKVSLSTKYDGSPSIVFGTHPEFPRFFVASKSAFNKNPKLNFTESDIEKNHGHSPGLVAKLKSALYHLPKVTPNEGVFQGDVMYNKSDKDVSDSGGSYHFKPNTITYSAKKGSEEGQKIKDAKFGVAVHTAYRGDTLENMKAEYNTDTSKFNSHPDVHVVDTKFDPKTAHYTPDAQQEYHSHMAKAVEAHNDLPNYDHLEGHDESLKTYINSTVRDTSKPSVEGYKKHLQGSLQKGIDKVKTDKAKQNKAADMNEKLDHIDTNKDSFKKTLDIHKHLQNAKNVLVNTMSNADYKFHHSIDGKKVKPEGHVAVLNNRPTKLVDRAEFSAANFAARPR